MSKEYPETLSVGEVSELLGLTTQQVRQMCINGELEAEERVSGTSRWSIKTEQFIHSDVWQRYLEQLKKRKENSLKIINSLIKIYEDK